MATPPDFTAGQVLTAAQINKIGLWLVKSETIGSAVSSVVVTDAFSSDYDAYRIIISGGTSSASNTLQLKLGASTANYYHAVQQVAYVGGTITGLGSGGAVSQWSIASSSTNNLHTMLDINQPALAKPTYFHNFESNGTTGYRIWSGVHNVSTAYTDFTLSIASGTMTGGTIRVYGYNAG